MNHQDNTTHSTSPKGSQTRQNKWLVKWISVIFDLESFIANFFNMIDLCCITSVIWRVNTIAELDHRYHERRKIKELLARINSAEQRGR